jgi:hypothetical protein
MAGSCRRLPVRLQCRRAAACAAGLCARPDARGRCTRPLHTAAARGRCTSRPSRRRRFAVGNSRFTRFCRFCAIMRQHRAGMLAPAAAYTLGDPGGSSRTGPGPRRRPVPAPWPPEALPAMPSPHAVPLQPTAHHAVPQPPPAHHAAARPLAMGGTGAAAARLVRRGGGGGRAGWLRPAAGAALGKGRAGQAGDEFRRRQARERARRAHLCQQGSRVGRRRRGGQRLWLQLRPPACPAARCWAAALALPGVQPASADSAPDQRSVSFRYLDYLDRQPGRDRVRIKAPTVHALAPLGSDWSVSGSLVSDAISGASPAYHSSALTRLRDERQAGELSLTRYLADGTVSVGAGYSTEADYVSRGLTAAGQPDPVTTATRPGMPVWPSTVMPSTRSPARSAASASAWPTCCSGSRAC